MDKNEDQNAPLKDHEYDGIQEYDNPAPFWWQLFFYLSILFGFCYYIYYEIGPGPSSSHELAQSMAQTLILQNQNRLSGPDVKQLLVIVADPSALSRGKETFVNKCAACHMADGGGLVGPNLTDSYWLHGKGKMLDIYNVVKSGVPDKGMPAWGSLLSDGELTTVVAFVKTLHGIKPANPKAPQGTEVSGNDSKD